MTITADLDYNKLIDTPERYAPKQPCQGWWNCLDNSDQALIIAATILALAILAAALILKRRRGHPEG